jgi:hypothetical protein
METPGGELGSWERGRLRDVIFVYTDAMSRRVWSTELRDWGGETDEMRERQWRRTRGKSYKCGSDEGMMWIR